MGIIISTDCIKRLYYRLLQNVSREMKRGYPDRRRLEAQCISCVTFVRSEAEVLDSPVWVMLINVVAMELLKSKMPPGELQS